MNKLTVGIMSGIVFGILDVILMIPLSFSDKQAAMLGAFVNRFAIGFFIGATNLPLPSWGQGALIGLLISLPDAIITKAYAPILGIGLVGGIIIGLIIERIK